MPRLFMFCAFLVGTVAPACALPVAPLVGAKQTSIEMIAARAVGATRAPKMRASSMRATTIPKASRSVSVTSVSVTIIRKERQPRKKPYAIPDIPHQK